MALKNQAITVCYVAWNGSTNVGQTGDSANHTLKLIQDGTEAAPTNTPTQVDAVNAPGVYKLALTAGDMNFNAVMLCGKSSTANVSIIPLQIITERGVLPTAAAGAASGMPLLDASSHLLVYSVAQGVTVATNSDKTGYALSSAGLDAITVEAGLNARQSFAIIAAACAGIGGVTSGIYAGAGVATQRIAFTAASGQRSVVTLSPPA